MEQGLERLLDGRSEGQGAVSRRRGWIVVVVLVAGCGSSGSGDGHHDANPPDVRGGETHPDQDADAASNDEGAPSDGHVAADGRFDTVADSPVETPSGRLDGASFDATSDAIADVTSDAIIDASSDGAVAEVVAPRARIFVALASPFAATGSSTDVVAVDVSQGRAVVDASLGGVIALADRNDALLAVRGGGYTRISILDPDTLTVTRTQILPFDPVAAVVSTDGRYLYATHGEGWVSQVRVADGVVTAEVQVPLPTTAITGSASLDTLAIDPSETLLAATGAHNGDGSTVVVLSIGAGSLTILDNWVSQPIVSVNCDRWATAPVFDRASTKLSTFDTACGAFDVYDLASQSLDPNASVVFGHQDGASSYVNSVVDARGQFWSSNYASLFRTSTATPNDAATFSFGPAPGPLLTDPTGETVYAFQHDPRTNGVYTIDLTTGAATRLPWNLDLVQLGAFVATTTYSP
jgi:hypothetical protein